jgi:hypothetical protein
MTTFFGFHALRTPPVADSTSPAASRKRHHTASMLANTAAAAALPNAVPTNS